MGATWVLCLASILVSLTAPLIARADSDAQPTTNGRLRVLLEGCAASGSSTVNLAALSAHGGISQPLLTDGDMHFADFSVEQGYYMVNVTGVCATPAVNQPFVILAAHSRTITLHTGSGIGLLLVGTVGAAGSVPPGTVTVYLDSAQGSSKVVLTKDAYYADYLSPGSYTLRALDAEGRELSRRQLDFHNPRLFTVYIVNL